jgi:hypothetical protein
MCQAFLGAITPRLRGAGVKMLRPKHDFAFGVRTSRVTPFILVAIRAAINKMIL